MDYYLVNNRSMAKLQDVESGTLTSCFEHIETPPISEPMSNRSGSQQQVFEKRQSHGDAECRSTAAQLERDFRAYGSRSVPLYEGRR
jgi:hypothetical protein